MSNHPDSIDIYEVAHHYAELGLPVIPLDGKVPALKGWQQFTADQINLRLWFGERGCNVGLRTGESGYVVIDTDSPIVKEQTAKTFPTVEVIDRPAHLLGGHTPMTEVLRYDAEQVPSDWYLQTHTTNPLLRSDTIDAALDRMQGDAGEHDSLFSVTRWQTRLYTADGTPINHDPDVLLRTQD